MAEKDKATIVIKKINVVAGGGHGGSWKVAFADFMTAMMAFFLLMWLLNQTPETKKNVSDYFSTPSIIEYNFSNFGVELTLEKLFLDLMNEPMKVLQDFMQPADYTPNYMQMGSKNIVMSVLSDEIGDFASGFDVTGDQIVIQIPEGQLFADGTANPKPAFAEHMTKLAKFVAGVEDSDIFVDSVVYLNSMPGGSEATGKNVAQKRLDLVLAQVDGKLEHQSVDLHQKFDVRQADRRDDGRPAEGYIKIVIKQKDVRQDGSKPRELSRAYGEDDKDMNVYNNFVNKLSNSKSKPKTKSK